MPEELKTKIISAIKKGEVTMRPRWHFVLRSALFILGIATAVLGLLFLSSLVMFLLRQSGVFFAPVFGFRGLHSFFFALPWLLIFVSFLFIIVLQLLARFYGLGRKTPLLYSALGLIVFVLCTTFIIGKIAFHERMSARAVDGRLPFVGQMYRSFPEPSNIHRGRVGDLFENGFFLVHRRGGTTSVMIGPETRLPHGIDFAEEDIVVVIGEKTNGTVVAEGIMKVDPEMFDPKGRGTKGKHLFMIQRAPTPSE